MRELAGIAVGVLLVVLVRDRVLRVVELRSVSEIGRHRLGTEERSVKAKLLSIVVQGGVGAGRGSVDGISSRRDWAFILSRKRRAGIKFQ